MRTHTHTLRSASTAIAAVLALGSTPLLAQAVSPTGDSVILAPAPAAPPVVQAAPPATTTAPVVQSLPDTYVPAKAAAPAVAPSAAPATTTANRAAAPARTAAARAAVAPVAPAPSAAAAASETAPVAGPVDAAPPQAQLFPPSETAQDNGPVITPKPAAEAVDDFTIVTGALGGLALLAFGWFGVTLARRRRTRKAVAIAPQVTRPVVAPRPEPIITAAAAPQALPETAVSESTPVMADPQAIPAPVITQPIRQGMEETPAVAARAESAFGAGHARWADDARPRSAQAAVKGALPSNGASVDLPSTRPETYEDRESLFKRMVEAKPDKANPFTDRRSRMKRARLIVASLDQDFADRDPWIDLSQYPNNWPELAKRRFPQAA